MTRKHFIEIARILRDNKASDELINDFARLCEKNNKNFDGKRFAEACGRS